MASQQRTVLITGCSKGGLGDALAQEFHRKDCRVFASARNLATVQHLQDIGIELVQLDVTDNTSINNAVATVSKLTGGTLDVLVNNAGLGYNAALLDVKIEDAKKVFDANFWGMLAMIQATTPLLVASRGRIVNLGSVAGKIPLPFQGIYGTSKASVNNLSDNLRIELAPFGISVINIMGAGFKSTFYERNNTYELPENSLYAPYKAEVEPALRGEMSKANSKCTVDEFAAGVVKNALASSVNASPWLGSLSSVIWFGTRFLWHTAMDGLTSTSFGLSAVATKVKAERKEK